MPVYIDKTFSKKLRTREPLAKVMEHDDDNVTAERRLPRLGGYSVDAGASFQQRWICDENGRINQPIESNYHIRQWMEHLSKIKNKGDEQRFAYEVQSALDIVYGVSEETMFRRLERPARREEVADSFEWKLFCGLLRNRFSEFDILSPQQTAEENGRDILLIHSQLMEMNHLREVLALSIKERVDKQGEIGLLRTELLEALMDGLDESYLAREQQEKALWQKPAKKKGLGYQKGTRSEFKHPLESTKQEHIPGKATSRKNFDDLGLFNASALAEAFTKIEIVKWEKEKGTQLGVFGSKLTLSQENKAASKADLTLGKAEGLLYVQLANKPVSHSEGERYKPGIHDLTLLRASANAELASKLGLSVEGSWTVGNLINTKVGGKAEMGTNAKVEAEACAIMTPSGPVIRATAGASAFAGFKAEASPNLNLFRSRFANAYGLSGKLKVAANFGVGASASATAAIGPQGAKLYSAMGVTLGGGGDISWEASVNAIVCRAYALELAARTVRKFNESKGQYWDDKAMQAATQYKLDELLIRVAGRIATLESHLNTLQSAFAEERIRSADNPISPGVTLARTVIAQAFDDYGSEQIGDDGQLRVVDRAMERYTKLGVTAGIMRNQKNETK